MPEFIAPVLKKIAELGIIPGHSFDQMTINDYFPGDGIPPHFDTHSPFEEYFVALSILSGIVM
jgi:alkylated DNA repair protein alkB family protein 8